MPRVQSPVPRTERQKKGRREGEREQEREQERENTRETCLSLLVIDWARISLLVDHIFEVLGIEPKV